MNEATRWATYAGDQTESVGQAFGPTTAGRMTVCVEAQTYTEGETLKTRLGFAYADEIVKTNTEEN